MTAPWEGDRVTPVSSDEELMKEFGETSDPAPFEILVGRHTSSAYRTALAILGAHHDAEDAVQECFLRAMRARRSFRPDMRFAVWLFAILRNICRDHNRRCVRATSAAARQAPRELGLDADLEAARGEEVGGALAAFAELPDTQREILALRIYEGLGFAEIAAICGVSEEAAKKRAQRGLDRLRRSLGAHATAVPAASRRARTEADVPDAVAALGLYAT